MAWTAEQLAAGKEFFASNPSAENIASAAQKYNLTANELADYYSAATGGNAQDALSNINAYTQQNNVKLGSGYGTPSTPAVTTPAAAPLGVAITDPAQALPSTMPGFRDYRDDLPPGQTGISAPTTSAYPQQQNPFYGMWGGFSPYGFSMSPAYGMGYGMAGGYGMSPYYGGMGMYGGYGMSPYYGGMGMYGGYGGIGYGGGMFGRNFSFF